MNSRSMNSESLLGNWELGNKTLGNTPLKYLKEFKRFLDFYQLKINLFYFHSPSLTRMILLQSNECNQMELLKIKFCAKSKKNNND